MINISIKNEVLKCFLWGILDKQKFFNALMHFDDLWLLWIFNAEFVSNGYSILFDYIEQERRYGRVYLDNRLFLECNEEPVM